MNHPLRLIHPTVAQPKFAWYVDPEIRVEEEEVERVARFVLETLKHSVH
jgi:hypothetical protein